MFDKKKVVEAAEVLKNIADCIFNFTNINCEHNGCMFNGGDVFPMTWETHLIEKG